MLGIQQISIHAPLTGSDYLAIFYVFQNKYFNPRSPHRERRWSTSPRSTCLRDFNPRSPHRERLCHSREPGRDAKISIHAPLTGSDGRSGCLLLRSGRFQSTLPSQGATANIHIKFLCDLLFSTLSSKNSFTLSRFPQTITWFCAICTDKLCANVPLYLCTLYIRTTLKTLR